VTRENRITLCIWVSWVHCLFKKF